MWGISRGGHWDPTGVQRTLNSVATSHLMNCFPDLSISCVFEHKFKVRDGCGGGHLLRLLPL